MRTLGDAPEEHESWGVKYVWQEEVKQYSRFHRMLSEDKVKLAGVIIGNMGNSTKERLQSTEQGRIALITKDPKDLITSIVATHLAGGVSQSPDRVFYHAVNAYSNIRMGEEETLPSFHQRFNGSVSALRLAATAANEELNVPSDKTQTQHFIGRLNGRYGDFKENYRRGLITDLDTVADANERAVSYGMDIRRWGAGRNNFRGVFATGRGRGRGRGSPGGKDKSEIECYACGKMGHYANECVDKTSGDGGDKEKQIVDAVAEKKAEKKK